MGFALEKMQDSPVRLKLGSPIYFSPTGSGCDCGSVLGSGKWKDERDSKFESRIEKSRKSKKGWSEAKLNRWIDQKKAARQGRARHQAALAESKSASIQSWMGLIKSMIETHGLSEFGLILHFYRGLFITEDFVLTNKIVVPVGKLDEKILEYMEEDVIYEFTKKSK